MQKLEHANLSCTDIDATTAFLQTAFPAFRVRGGGTDDHGRRWQHVGNDDAYLALTEVPGESARAPYSDKVGMNHLGWEVDDIAGLEARMNAAGFTAKLRNDSHPARRRRYFYDPDGNDWEFVEYTTEDPAQRHDYGR